jgi:hypothetical protein
MPIRGAATGNGHCGLDRLGPWVLGRSHPRIEEH